MKKYGLHHLLIGLPLAFLLGPLANAIFWFGKELGEATERAGGNKKALTTFTIKTKANPKGIWEPFDFIAPSIAGYALDAVVTKFFS